MMKESAVRLDEGAEDFESIRRGLVLLGLGYLGLVVVAMYADYKIKMRRARKKREAERDGSTDKDPQP